MLESTNEESELGELKKMIKINHILLRHVSVYQLVSLFQYGFHQMSKQ